MGKGTRNRNIKSFNKGDSSNNPIILHKKKSWGEYLYSLLRYKTNEVTSNQEVKELLAKGKELYEKVIQGKEELNQKKNPKLIPENANPKKQNFADAVVGAASLSSSLMNDIASSNPGIKNAEQGAITNYQDIPEALDSTSHHNSKALLFSIPSKDIEKRGVKETNTKVLNRNKRNIRKKRSAPGAMGSEVQVNTFINDNQQNPSIAILTNGDFVVTWDSNSQDRSYKGVYAQIFNPNGQKVRSEFRVNSHTANSQSNPSVVLLINGNFVITWTSNAQDGYGDGVYAQIFNSSGAKVGSEFQVNTYTYGNQWIPSIASLNNGNFVVTWPSDSQSYFLGVYAQIFNINGRKVGPEFRVNNYRNDNQNKPSITSLFNEGFVITWQSENQDESGYGIYGQIFHSNGSKMGSEFQVNTYTNSDQLYPSVTSLTNGNIVVSWTSNYQEGDTSDSYNQRGVYAQIFTPSGQKIRSEFQVNTYTSSHQQRSSVAALTNGNFVISWISALQDGSQNGVYAQIFNSSGGKVEHEFRVNSYTNRNQLHPSITSSSGGGFIITWQSYNQDGNNYGIFAQRFDSRGNKIGLESIPTDNRELDDIPKQDQANTLLTEVKVETPEVDETRMIRSN